MLIYKQTLKTGRCDCCLTENGECDALRRRTEFIDCATRVDSRVVDVN